MKILIVAAHPDDIEFGMGGTLSLLVENKNIRFKVVVCSDCEEQPGNKGITKEFEQSMDFFGIDDYEILGLPNTKLPSVSDKIREKLELIKKEFEPDLVFTTSKKSIHQDHKIVAIEVERILRNIGILSFEDVKSCPNFLPSLYFTLDENHVNGKLKSLKFYKSQFNRYYHDDELLRSLLIFRGGQIGEKYAESFETIRLISKIKI